MRQHYKHQPIVAINWLPRIGKNLFGRLALVEKQDSSIQAESAWHLLRGQVDKTVKLTENKEISLEDVLQPTDSSLSLRVVIDGPPGIGKTTLCCKLLNMWSNGPLVYQQYDLVLYCPLRNSKIATATTLADLFVCQLNRYKNVPKWFEERDGEGLLIIFDGWDELSEQLRQSSLAVSIIHRKQLDQCSVIVTSRSYASSSLLKMDTLSRHVQVFGFSKEEISTVIIQTLQKDTKLAQELIDKKKEDDKNNEPFTTTQSSKDSQLAVKLINDLEVRNDVQSLCHVPLVCSMVILVYCKEGGHLPTTLTQLYENFILQTIRRHVLIHVINPRTLGSLSSLPSQLAKPLQQMCQLAYTNLANTRMTFSSHQLQSLSEAVKEDYLGLMTTFTDYDEEKYQFLHLSIQEFLAAWWIAKHEKKTEEVFKDHFDDDHFRMCLRFVAGLTHLEHESYQQYFNKQQLDLQCKREPLFGFETCHLSYFYQNPEIRIHYIMKDHISSDDSDNVPILLLQLLYESQNTTLCQVLAQSINNHSLCLDRISLSLFDWLCLSYCINNSNTTWNHLHLGTVSNQSLSVFTAGLTNNSLQTQCKGLEVVSYEHTDELIHISLQSYSIQECYCVLSYDRYVPCLVLLQFLNLPQLKILHLIMDDPTIPTVDNTYYIDKCTELEKCIEINSTLQEMKIEYEGWSEITSTIISVIRGVTRNKTITSLTIHVPYPPPPPLPYGVIEQLLKDNNTLQALSLNISDRLLPSSLNIVEVNTPLTALEIGGWSSKLMISLLPHIIGLHCLILHKPYPPHLLFLSHPSLHTLTLPLDTAESAIELFTILQTNTTLKALSVEIKEERVYTSSMGTSLQDMLTQNQTLKYLEINSYKDTLIAKDIPIPSSFLSFLTTVLRHNTSLQQLSVSIPFPLNEEIRTFINVISQKNNLTELKVNFEPDQSYSNCSREEKEQIMTPLFYEQVLPAVTNMLQSHTTIRLLRIELGINNKSSQPNWIEVVQHLYETIFIDPSLEYIEIKAGNTTPPFLVDTLKDQKKILINRRKKELPHRPLLKIMNGSSIVISLDNLSAIAFEESLKNALKEDFLNYSVSTAIVQGEARVGKTCLKSLILSLPYTSLSTPVIEAPFIAFGNFSIDCYGSTKGKCWTPVNDDEMNDKVIAELQKHALDKGNKINSKASISQELSKNEENVLPFHATVDDSVEATQQSMETNEINNYEEGELDVVHDGDAVHNDIDIADQQPSSMSANVSTHERKVISVSLQDFDPLEYCKKLCNIDEFDSHREWLYFIDSGGQLQFQKLLLAFMPHTSVLILVVNLSKNLSDKSCTKIQRDSETIDYGNDYSLKVEDMLKQILSAVASNAQKVTSIIDDFPWIEHKGEKLNVLTVGTHLDKYNKNQEKPEVESLDNKRNELRKILKSVSKSIQIVYDQSLLDVRKNPIHVIDGRKAGEFNGHKAGESSDKAVEVIAKCLKDQSYKIKVPLRWHYFGVILRKKSKETSGILDLPSCVEFGEMLHMKPQEVHNALKFFHILKMLFYYDDSPAKDIVFVKLDCLVSIINDLMSAVIDFRKMDGLDDNEKQLATEGCLSIKSLKSTDSFKKISLIFNNDDDFVSKMLLGLFQHLDIAAQISEEEFLMPALLPLIDVSDTEVATLETTPLLFYFKDRAVPMGLFCAAIVHLLSDSWTITSKQGNYSNFFTLQKAYQIINFTLVEQLDCIEIHCKKAADKTKVKDALEKSMNEVMKKKNIDNELPILAFYCPCCNTRDHKATVKNIIIKEDSIIVNSIIVNCEEFVYNSEEDSEEYCSWFTSEEDIKDECE